MLWLREFKHRPGKIWQLQYASWCAVASQFHGFKETDTRKLLHSCVVKCTFFDKNTLKIELYILFMLCDNNNKWREVPVHISIYIVLWKLCDHAHLRFFRSHQFWYATAVYWITPFERILECEVQCVTIFEFWAFILSIDVRNIKLEIYKCGYRSETNVLWPNKKIRLDLEFVSLIYSKAWLLYK